LFIILYAPQIPEDQDTHSCRKVVEIEGDSSLGYFPVVGFGIGSVEYVDCDTTLLFI